MGGGGEESKMKLKQSMPFTAIRILSGKVVKALKYKTNNGRKKGEF